MSYGVPSLPRGMYSATLALSDGTRPRRRPYVSRGQRSYPRLPVRLPTQGRMMNEARRAVFAIRGVTVATASSLYQADIGIVDGQVARIGGDFSAAEEIDATGKYVLPGGIDAHVHLTPATLPDGGELRWADDFGSGTRAAAAGGITTVGNITFPRPNEGLLELLQRVTAEVTPLAYVDFALHPVVLDPSLARREDLQRLVEQGHTSIKIFMILGNFDGQARQYLDAMRHAAEL